MILMVLVTSAKMDMSKIQEINNSATKRWKAATHTAKHWSVFVIPAYLINIYLIIYVIKLLITVILSLLQLQAIALPVRIIILEPSVKQNSKIVSLKKLQENARLALADYL